MLRNIDQFYLNQDEPYKSCLLALRDLILKQDIHLVESIKWGMPCFCYQKKMCCFLWIDKKTNEPYILFVEGALLHHPTLVQGKRRKMKVFSINPNKDLPIRTIKSILQEAIHLFKGT